MTGLGELIELQDYIKEQIRFEESWRTYHTTQRGIAYRRVLQRLDPIIRQLKKTRKQLEGLPVPLTTLKEYQKLSPRVQGYVVYMEAKWEGSELKDQKNPYKQGSGHYDEWNIGANIAMMEAQDGDDE